MVIGLFGLDFGSNNLGCVALSYGFIEILKKTNIDEKIEIICFDECDEKVANKLIDSAHISLTVAPKRSLKRIKGFNQLITDYKRCDLIFDSYLAYRHLDGKLSITFVTQWKKLLEF